MKTGSTAKINHIRIDKVPVYWYNSISKDILKIKDLLNDNVQFYSYNDFIHKYTLRCNLMYVILWLNCCHTKLMEKTTK